MVCPSLVLFMVKRLIGSCWVVSHNFCIKVTWLWATKGLVLFITPYTLVIYSLPTLNFASQIARSCNKNAEKKRTGSSPVCYWQRLYCFLMLSTRSNYLKKFFVGAEIFSGVTVTFGSLLCVEKVNAFDRFNQILIHIGLRIKPLAHCSPPRGTFCERWVAALFRSLGISL